ncbi:hypothetical protein FQN60_001679, partial [Etheostoma spectabile]
GRVLANSTFGRALLDGTLGLPQDALLPGAQHLGPQPRDFAADEASPLRHNLMRPFPGSNHSGRRRVFNFRLSHARLIVENSFGILTSQWHMYREVTHRHTLRKPKNSITRRLLFSFAFLQLQNARGNVT